MSVAATTHGMVGDKGVLLIFLVSDTNPDGYRLEDILRFICKDFILRRTKVLDNARPEAQHVIYNDMRILTLLSEAINIAEDSTLTLKKAFWPNSGGGKPRIGTS